MKEIQLKKEVIVDDLIVYFPLYLAATAATFKLHLYPKTVWIGDDEYAQIWVFNPMPAWIHFHVWCFWVVVTLKAFGVRFLRRERVVPLRRRPTKEILDRYINYTKLHFVGFVNTFGAQVRNVLHPFDYFMDGLMRRFCPAEREDALKIYKRTNATLNLRLDQADKFARNPILSQECMEHLQAVRRDLEREVTSHSSFQDFSKGLNFSVGGAFEDLNIDWTAAAGFPFKAGIKRGQAYGEAVETAYSLLYDDHAFKEYMNQHVWYTTGRAKLQPVEDEPSARIICYPGYASMMLSGLYFQPFQRLMNSFRWSAVGMTWTSGGARRFAEFFGDCEGRAPPGYSYCSLDISGWDASMGATLLDELRQFHISIQQAANVPCNYIARFSTIFRDMINAIIVFPMGYAFATQGGMKSGWPNTSHDDTLGHKMVFTCIEDDIGVDMPHQLYGDDNFFLLPDGVDVHLIIDCYAKYGFKVKHMHVSKNLADVDFLSKRIQYINGEYYIYRDTVETMARLLMPEESDPGDRDVPDEIIAAERLIGHLFDNPFNTVVRDRIYSCLAHLRDFYHIYDVNISDSMIKAYKWRNIDITRIKNVPIIPSMDFINELYGVSAVGLNVVWPTYVPSLYGISYVNQEPTKESFMITNHECRRVYNRLYELGKKKRPTCIKYTSPFISPFGVRGYHGARFEFAVKHFSIRYKTVLDFGCHPGACAFSMVKDPSVNVVGVSLIPPRDNQRCPYVIRSSNFKFIECDVNEYKIDMQYDLLHDDVDEVIARNQYTDAKYAQAALLRGAKAAASVKQFLMTVHDIDSTICGMIYDCYRMYGHFDIVRPLYSNPWKCEFMLYFCKSSKPIVKKKVFLRALNSYLNSFTTDMLAWAGSLETNINKMLRGEIAERCPDQENQALQRTYREKLF